jgi:hypothetical protein
MAPAPAMSRTLPRSVGGGDGMGWDGAGVLVPVAPRWKLLTASNYARARVLDSCVHDVLFFLFVLIGGEFYALLTFWLLSC